jgi:hypothetical protein
LDLLFNTVSPTEALATYNFDNNQYYFSASPPGWPTFWAAQWRTATPADGGYYTWAQWQAAGQDTNSTLTMVPKVNNKMQVPDKVVLRRNAYDPARAHLIIYNWANADRVAVTAQQLGGFMNAGDRYRLSNVQDYFADRELGTYDGSVIEIAMTGRSVAKPIGYDSVTAWYNGPPPIRSTFPEFGVFVLERLAPATESESTPSPPTDVRVD